MSLLQLEKYNIHKGHLILVNRENPINEALEHKLPLIELNEEPTEILLEQRAATMLKLLLNNINSTDQIVPVSGYRSNQEQQKIYQDSLLDNGAVFTSKYVAYPNHSEHQTGLAIDLAEKKEQIDFIRPDFTYEGICKRFRDHAAQYGFIERYQKGKENITGIAHEPWHFRYVGYPHSKMIQMKEFALEEYIDFLKKYPYQQNHYLIDLNHQSFELCYIPNHILEIKIPDDVLYQISGNNVDGYILTIWKERFGIYAQNGDYYEK